MSTATANTHIDKIANMLLQAHSVAIICHINPDGDTIGSGLALWHMLNKAGIKSDIYCENSPSEKLKFIDGSDCISNKLSDKRYDLSVAVDCNNSDRMGEMYYIFERAQERLIIDHHLCIRHINCANLIDSNAAATAQIMHKVLLRIENSGRAEIDNIIAKCLYCALVTDSGAFSFPSVTSETMNTAAQLLQFDIKADKIVTHFIKSIKPNVYKLKCSVLSRTKLFEDGKISLINFSKEDFISTSTNPEDTDGIINATTDIEGVCISISICEVGDKSYKISIRTKEPIRADMIASVFGGGGHARAAGCRINGYYEDIKDKVLKACRDCL